MEELCDEERYVALSKDLDEEAAYQEEELKRLRSTLGDGAAIGFSYDGVKNVQAVESDSTKTDHVDEPEEEEPDEPFVAPNDLHVPSDLVTV